MKMEDSIQGIWDYGQLRPTAISLKISKDLLAVTGKTKYMILTSYGVEFPHKLARYSGPAKVRRAEEKILKVSTTHTFVLPTTSGCSGARRCRALSPQAAGTLLTCSPDFKTRIAGKARGRSSSLYRKRSCGPMDKASAHGAGDCRLESYQ